MSSLASHHPNPDKQHDNNRDKDVHGNGNGDEDGESNSDYIVSVSFGCAHAAAVTRTGCVYMWGEGTAGCLG